MAKSWQRLSRQKLFEDRRIRVFEDVIQSPELETSQYTLIDFSDAVFIIAKDPIGNIALLTQFRYPTGKVATEIIAGGMPKGVDPLEQAAAELHQEAGLSALETRKIGQFYMQPSRAINVGHVVVAEVADPSTATIDNQESDETIQTIGFYSPGEVRGMLADGSIDGAYCVASLGMYFASAAQM